MPADPAPPTILVADDDAAIAALTRDVLEAEGYRVAVAPTHAAALAGHAALLAPQGVVLAGPSDPVLLTVGDLAERIWHAAGGAGALELDLVGIRPGETLSEVLTGPDERLGEEVGAAIVLRNGASLDEQGLRAFLGERVAKFKIPSHVWFRTEPLPRNANGKFVKRDLRDEYVGADA